MTLSRFLVVGVAVCGMWLPARGGEPKPDETQLRHAEAVASLATAAQLASYGRGELAELTGLKGAKSPEALIAAGGILLRAGAALGAEPEAVNEKGEPDAKAKVRSLKDQATDLFDEALGMAGNDKAKQAALTKLIEQAKAVPSGESRGAVGKPRTVTRTIPPASRSTSPSVSSPAPRRRSTTTRSAARSSGARSSPPTGLRSTTTPAAPAATRGGPPATTRSG